MDARQRITCSMLTFQVFDAGGLKSLRPVLLGEKTVNLDLLILRSLTEQKFFDADSELVPLVSSSIDLVLKKKGFIIIIIFLLLFSKDNCWHALLFQFSMHRVQVPVTAQFHSASCDA